MFDASSEFAEAVTVEKNSNFDLKMCLSPPRRRHCEKNIGLPKKKDYGLATTV